MSCWSSAAVSSAAGPSLRRMLRRSRRSRKSRWGDREGVGFVVVSSARSSAAPVTRAEEVILQRVTERAEERFPGVGPRPIVGIRPLTVRPRAQLYSVRVGSGSQQHRVLAKVRRDWPGAAREAGARPRLASQLLPASELTALEFGALTQIFAVFGDRPAAFGAVRPLDHLEAEDAILME